MMNPFAKKIFAIVMLLIFMCLIWVFSVSGTNYPAKDGANYWLSWLSKLVRDEVVVIFVSAPPGIGHVLKARLMEVGNAGIVLNFGKDEAFFSYANIISTEPAPQINTIITRIRFSNAGGLLGGNRALFGPLSQKYNVLGACLGQGVDFGDLFD